MRRPVRWSRRALDDLGHQLSYIAGENPVAARRVAARIRATGDALAELATGRPGRLSETYEKLVTGLPYIIAYAISRQALEETIIILRVVHMARDRQAGRWPKA